MNIKEFAGSINGKECGCSQFTKDEIKIANENGFVIVYGASDYLMKFEGAMRDIVGCWEGGTAWVSKNRIMDAPVFEEDKPIKAIWCGGEKDANDKEITWIYKTEIPHETFMIYDDGEPYCRGIVFDIDDVKQ